MKLFLEINFAGGLGNQMFQYAAGRSLSVKNKIPFLLLNSDDYNNKLPEREFSLPKLKIRGTLVTGSITKKLFRRNTKLNRLATFLSLHKTINEKGFSIHDLSGKAGLLTSLHGFWQSAEYFNDIRPVLLDELVPRELPPLPGWAEKKNTVAVHVRRTDYLLEKRYGFLGEQYYHDSIELMKSKLDDPLFVFFSDDMEWCKQKFNDEGVIFCEEELWKRNYLQLYLMSRCHHQVIANSSFSWWGAWLNNDPQKLVLRPAKPFANAELLYASHYPKEWIPVNN